MTTKFVLKKIFESEKKSRTDKKQLFTKLIEKIEKIKPDDYELLEDIKLEIQEDIPLSSHKKEYLKNCLQMLKQNKHQFNQTISTQKQSNTNSDTEISRKISTMTIQRLDNKKTTPLEEIKTTIKNINIETAELKKLVNSSTSFSDISILKQRYEKAQSILDDATSSLYSIQSLVYDKLQEIQKIKNGLAEIREKIESEET